VDEALANAERYMAELRGMDLTEHPPLYQQGAEILEELEQLMSNPETVMGIPSQFSAINALTLGWHKDALTIIAAIPGAGKTSYMLGEALHAARLGQRVGIVSQEMDNKSLLLRLVSAETGINLQSLRSGKLASDEYRKVITAMGRITALPLYLYDKRVTPAQLRAKALHWGSRDGLDLLFVDYLQIMQPGIKSDNRAAQVADIARALKDLNRELHIPVVVAAQLNRELYSRPDKRPQLSDLKESSEIEQAADMVMFIHQPAMFEPPDGASQTIAQFIIAKQRNGPTGEVKLAFDRKTTRFVEALVRHIDMSAL
jgi:replicative DNA helicase